MARGKTAKKKLRLTLLVLYISTIFSQYIFSTSVIGGSLPIAEDAEQNLAVLIVGAFRNGKNLPNWDVYKHNGLYWFSVVDLQEHLGLEFPAPGPDTLQADTPIGQVTIPSDLALSISGKFHLSGETLQQYLRIESVFNDADFAMYFSVPWEDTKSVRNITRNRPKIDFKAPTSSLSFVQLNSESYNGLSQNFEKNNFGLTLGGNAIGGTWFTRLEKTLKAEMDITDYFWIKSSRHSTHRIGTNYTDLSNLLENFSYTGIQSAWTNTEIGNFTDVDLNSGDNTFVLDNVATKRSIVRHDGPPAGIALLKINGRNEAMVRVNLNGTYTFSNIKYQTQTQQKIEIHLYNHNISTAPTRIIDISRNVGKATLGKNHFFVKGGAGKNSINQLEKNDNVHANNYIHLRYGLTDKVTIGLAAQSIKKQQTSLLAGLNASIGKHWALNFNFASQQNRGAIELGFSGSASSWRSEFTATAFQAGFNSHHTKPFSDIKFHGRRKFRDSVVATLDARSYKDGINHRVHYALPGVSGKYDSKWHYYLTPDSRGVYGLGIEYSGKPKHKTTLSHHKTQGSSLFHSYNPIESQTWRFGTRYNRNSIKDSDIFAQLNINPLRHTGNNFQIAFSRSRVRSQGVVNLHKTLPSGLTLQLQYERSKASEVSDKTVENLWLRTQLKFHRSNRKFVPATNGSMFTNRGGITATIVDQQGKTLPLNEVGLKVNGNMHFKKSENGGFYISKLLPGIYNIELDEQNLPIEYNASNAGVTVEVNPSSTTTVILPVNAKYGVSGRLKANAKDETPIPNKTLTLYDKTGTRIKETTTDMFGFYRLDGLQPGLYEIEYKHNNVSKIEVLVTDDYVFDQDILVE